MQDAMMRSSPPPEPVLGKRTHQGDDAAGNGTDTEPDEGPSSSLTVQAPSISNVTVSTLRYTAKKKLRPEQREEVEAFLLDLPLGRQAKLFACILSLENKTNINNYGLAIILSINISAYKGDIPRNHVLDILKKYRFDLPVGIEHDYANWEKISAYVGYSLTQSRARVKKLIKDSIKSDTDIFSLAQVIVHSTPCRPTVQLCACVALMVGEALSFVTKFPIDHLFWHTIYAECNGSEKYWNLIDARLEFIRSVVGLSASKAARAFNEILKNDRAKYRADEDYSIGNTIPDEWQQGVDNAIAGSAAGVVTGVDEVAAA